MNSPPEFGKPSVRLLPLPFIPEKIFPPSVLSRLTVTCTICCRNWKQLSPKYFPDITEHPTRFFNDADALDVLNRINQTHVLEKLKQEALRKEENAQEKEKAQENEKSEAAREPERTPEHTPKTKHPDVKSEAAEPEAAEEEPDRDAEKEAYHSNFPSPVIKEKGQGKNPLSSFCSSIPPSAKTR